jgi:hypothetical protein
MTDEMVLITPGGPNQEVPDTSTSDVPEHHSDKDFLIFFLTSKLSTETKEKILDDVGRGEYRDGIVTVDWSQEESGTEEDVKRLLRQSCVQGEPFQCNVVGFIDDQTAKDNTILMAESMEWDGQLSQSRRMISLYTFLTAVSCSLALLTLEEAPEED